MAVLGARGKWEVQKDEAGAKPARGAAMRAGSPPAHKVLDEAAEAATLDRSATQERRENRGDMMLNGIVSC